MQNNPLPPGPGANSLIVPAFRYPENKKVNDEDKGRPGDMYIIDIVYDMPHPATINYQNTTTKSMPIIIVLGKERDEYLKKYNIVYYPIYMVKTSGRMDKIGVFEMTPAIKLHLLNKNNEIDVERLSAPRLFSFVTREYMLQNAITEDQLNKLLADKNPAAKIKTAPPDSVPIDVLEKYKTLPRMLVNTGTIDIAPDFPIPGILLPETKADNMAIERDFERTVTTNSHHNWLQQFMKNANYNIVETVSDGNCFFDAITKALRSVGLNTTPDKLRKALAEQATEDDYKTYKDIYDATQAVVGDSKKNLLQIGGEYNMIKSRMENTLDREERIKLYRGGMRLNVAHAGAKTNHKAYNDVAAEFAFMRGVKSLGDFKKAIEKPSFWADAWAISKLQILLEAKIIIIKPPAPDNDNPRLSALITCDEKPAEVKDIFRPRYYIMVEYSGGNHYRLIEYKHKSVFQFSELPFKIKLAIHLSCVANTDAGFYIAIPDFSATKQKLHQRAENKANKIDQTIMSFHMPGKKLYDDAAPVFTIGINVPDDIDKINKKDAAIIAKYAPLYTPANKIVRKQLANEWMNTQKDKSAGVLFNLDNHNWASATHYILGSKYKHNNPAFYLNFSLDSKSNISKNVGLAKAAAGKDGKYVDSKTNKVELLRPPNVTPDPEYNNNIRKILYDANNAKFEQNSNLKNALLGTYDAKLMYYYDKKPPVLADELMRVRADLRKSAIRHS